MISTKRYAIRCSTEEQARECREKELRYIYVYVGKVDSMRIDGYTIITYEEAKELKLLGNKKKCFYCGESKCNCEQQEIIERHIADNKPQQEEDVIEKIMVDMEKYKHSYEIDRGNFVSVIERYDILDTLKKHLSSKK